jgi:hypothetical protein
MLPRSASVELLAPDGFGGYFQVVRVWVEQRVGGRGKLGKNGLPRRVDEDVCCTLK